MLCGWVGGGRGDEESFESQLWLFLCLTETRNPGPQRSGTSSISAQKCFKVCLRWSRASEWPSGKVDLPPSAPTADASRSQPAAARKKDPSTLQQPPSVLQHNERAFGEYFPVARSAPHRGHPSRSKAIYQHVPVPQVLSKVDDGIAELILNRCGLPASPAWPRVCARGGRGPHSTPRCALLFLHCCCRPKVLNSLNTEMVCGGMHRTRSRLLPHQLWALTFVPRVCLPGHASLPALQQLVSSWQWCQGHPAQWRRRQGGRQGVCAPHSMHVTQQVTDSNPWLSASPALAPACFPRCPPSLPTAHTNAPHQAFCAGGDVKRVALDVGAGNSQEALAFFRAEYLLDAAISQLQLPHISLLDGITMGGGAGISMHGHFRVATDKWVQSR